MTVYELPHASNLCMLKVYHLKVCSDTEGFAKCYMCIYRIPFDSRCIVHVYNFPVVTAIS